MRSPGASGKVHLREGSFETLVEAHIRSFGCWNARWVSFPWHFLLGRHQPDAQRHEHLGENGRVGGNTRFTAG